MVEFAGVTSAISGRDEFAALVKEIGDADRRREPFRTRAATKCQPSCSRRRRRFYRAQMETFGQAGQRAREDHRGQARKLLQAKTVLPDSGFDSATRTGKTSVKDVLAAANKGLGASVSVTRFARLKVGEAAQ